MRALSNRGDFSKIERYVSGVTRGKQGRAAASGRRWKRGRKMSLPVYILIYFGGQMDHKGGTKLGFCGNFVSNCGKAYSAKLWCVMVYN